MNIYIKYLLAKPGKLIWIVGLNLLLGVIGYAFFSQIEAILQDNPFWLIVVVCIILTIIRIVIDLQPYIEWKDGNTKRP